MDGLAAGLFGAAAGAFAYSALKRKEARKPIGPFHYPRWAPTSHSDVIHGRTVPDPYRWLEDADGEATRTFVDEQVDCTNGYFKTHAKGAALKTATVLEERLKEVWNFEQVGVLRKRGDWYYFYRREGLQNQFVLFRCREATAESMRDAEVFLDLNAEYPDGTTAIASSAWTEDGSLFAYGLSFRGSDWQVLKVRRASDKKDLDESVPWAKHTGITWLRDGRGFFYSRYRTPSDIAIGDGAAGGKDAGTEVDANSHQMVYFHLIGTPASQDRLVFRSPENPLWLIGADVTEDGRYLLILPRNGCDPVNRLFFCDLHVHFDAWIAAGDRARAEALGRGLSGVPDGEGPQIPHVKFVDNFEAEYEYLANDGPLMFFKTNLHAPKNRVVRVRLPATADGKEPTADDIAAAFATMEDVIPESLRGHVLESACVMARSRILCVYMEDVVNSARVFSLYDPTVPSVEIPMPAPGTVSSLGGERKDEEVFFMFTSYLHPASVMRADLGRTSSLITRTDTETPSARCASEADEQAALASAVQLVYETRVPGYDSSQCVSERVFVTSKDGTRIPLFITRLKRTAASGTPAPCILYGYGGFNISLNPAFSLTRVVWMQTFGGVACVANIRGGGEYGEDWHKAGSLFKKQNCFDDFCACAEHLFATGVTDASKLAIMGGSNGGLLVLACMLQRPELFRVVISQVPVADMLRFHRFTVGHAWVTDYGCADTSKEELDCLLAYSPLHNVVAPVAGRLGREGTPLPSTLILTADHDDRVVPLHTFKMIAMLQNVAGASPAQIHPLLARIEKNAGHGAGKPTSKTIREFAEIYAFIATEIGLPVPEPREAAPATEGSGETAAAAAAAAGGGGCCCGGGK